jgi:hypothetical protein
LQAVRAEAALAFQREEMHAGRLHSRDDCISAGQVERHRLDTDDMLAERGGLLADRDIAVGAVERDDDLYVISIERGAVVGCPEIGVAAAQQGLRLGCVVMGDGHQPGLLATCDRQADMLGRIPMI